MATEPETKNKRALSVLVLFPGSHSITYETGWNLGMVEPKPTVVSSQAR